MSIGFESKRIRGAGGEGGVLRLYRRPQILNYSGVLVIGCKPNGEINQFAAAADSYLSRGQSSLTGEAR